MKKITRTIAFVILASLFTPSQAAQVVNNISGTLGVAENGCVLPIAVFMGLNCEFSGGPTHALEIALYPPDNIGPVNSGGFYASIGAAPGFVLSTQTGNEFDHLNRPLTSFLVGLPATPGDGKTNVTITGVITIDDGGDGFGDTTDTIAGTIILGPGTHQTAAGNNLAGNKTVIESWTNITHTLLPTAVSSATSNTNGGFDYVIGSRGFPDNITTAAESFAAEAPAQSSFPLSSPWLDFNGGSISTSVRGPVDIVSFGLKAFPANVGAETTAVIAGLTCSDVGTDPTESDTMGIPIIDTQTDCQDNLAVWSVVDPSETDAGKLTAGFDNLVLKLSTDAAGIITDADAYYTIEFPIIQPADTSWVGGTLSFTGDEAPPPVASIYAVTGAGNALSTLYEINRDTAALIRTVGATGFRYITAMDFNPLTGELYAIAQDASSCCPDAGDLLTLDVETGQGSFVARTGAFSDMGFHPDGRLFGNGKPDGFDDRVYEIDIESGAYTLVADFGHPHKPGISFDVLGNGTTKANNSFYSFNPDIPSTSFIGNISGTTLLNTLEYDQDNILLGITSSSVVTIDLNSRTQTIVGPVITRYSALASQPVPCFTVDAIDDQFTLINDGTPADLKVLRNDECRSDRPITVVTLSGDLVPDQGGSATTDGSIVTYTPPGGFTGPESFTYTAQDAGLDGGDDEPVVDQDTASVTVTLLEDLIPDAVADDLEIQQRQTVFIDVLENDTLGNPENVVSIETLPENGNANVESDNRIRYFPDSRFFGLESFDYRVTDANGDSDVATVNVGVFFTSGIVPIDIVPGKDINNINLGAGGRIQIAILSEGIYLDAPALINPFSLKFGHREANIIGSPSVRDIDHDGDDDLLVKFLIEQTGIICGELNGFLTGETFEFGNINGFDSINTFKCRKRPISY